jgi:hypothetical protein
MKPGAPSARVVEAVAGQEGVSPTELSEPLHDVIDTEALDGLVAGENGRSKPVRITFAYNGYDVSVEGGDGEDVSVTVRSNGTEPDATP